MAKRNILITSLDSMENRFEHRFFYYKDGKKTVYCDAVGVAEAGAKYILSKVDIDEIIVLGTGATYNKGDELRHIELSSFSDYNASEIDTLSEYEFFRYRIAQYIHELDIEGIDVYEDIDPERKEELIAVYNDFLSKAPEHVVSEDRKKDSMFHLLTTDRVRYEKLLDILPDETEDHDLAWLHRYIYNRLEDSFKLRALPENDYLEMCFIPTTEKRISNVPIENIREIIDAIHHNDAEVINLYMDMQGIGYISGNTLIQIMSMLSDQDSCRVELKEIITTHYDADSFASPIDNQGMRSYSLSQLVSGMKAFIQFGKVDTIREFWESRHIQNKHIEKLLYGMKCVDDGISLCHIGDLEYGIRILKLVFSETPREDLPEMESNIFTVLEEVIRADYGELLEGKEIDSMALIRWAYRKKFYQQVLTVIESRIPKDIVREGILYYAIDEDSKVAMLEEIADDYFGENSKNKWFFDDLDHYFIKYYGRNIVYAKQSPEDRARDYVKMRVESVYHGRDGLIKAWSRLENKPEVLREVLEAYYLIAPIRNEINHAESRAPERSMDEIDVHKENERMTLLTGAIERFISAYETALAEREPGDTPATIDRDEFRDYVNANK